MSISNLLTFHGACFFNDKAGKRGDLFEYKGHKSEFCFSRFVVPLLRFYLAKVVAGLAVYRKERTKAVKSQHALPNDSLIGK